MRKYKTYPKSVFKRAASESRSWRQLASKLGMRYCGTAHRILPRIAAQMDVDTSHFKGIRWRTGLKHSLEKSLEETLTVGNSHPAPTRLINRLVAAGLKNRVCGRCSHDTWLGQPIPLILSHRNADVRDYRLENLEFMCPNCHRVMLNMRLAARSGSKNAKYSRAKTKKLIGK
jgi:hypothetical protein